LYIASGVLDPFLQCELTLNKTTHNSYIKDINTLKISIWEKLGKAIWGIVKLIGKTILGLVLAFAFAQIINAVIRFLAYVGSVLVQKISLLQNYFSPNIDPNKNLVLKQSSISMELVAIDNIDLQLIRQGKIPPEIKIPLSVEANIMNNSQLNVNAKLDLLKQFNGKTTNIDSMLETVKLKELELLSLESKYKTPSYKINELVIDPNYQVKLTGQAFVDSRKVIWESDLPYLVKNDIEINISKLDLFGSARVNAALKAIKQVVDMQKNPEGYAKYLNSFVS